MIGDDLEKDVLGALKCGLNAILFDPDNRYPEYNEMKVNDLNDLLIFNF